LQKTILSAAVYSDYFSRHTSTVYFV